ncbi:helix-turn-helix domain-containing protein [Streptomyces sp. NPDC056227]|uniref:helix-turn-helix domain-containing protein n=1 Tax=Streptomyces sp. NPDC056227 TaxID=3345753 RepID=UPI0035D7990F
MELDVIGLRPETQRVYTALVERPRSTGAEIAELLGTSASTAGRELSALVRRGLATRTPTRPARYTAAAPDIAITELIHESQQQLNAARSLVQELADMHREALRIGDPSAAVEVLSGPENILATVGRLREGARHLLRAFDCPPYLDRPGSGLEDQLRRQRAGVAHRVIYAQEALAWPNRLRDDIIPSMRAGEQARVRPKLPLKLLLADDRAAIIPFSFAPSGTSAAYLVHPSPMLVALEALFEAEWSRAAALRSGAEAGTDGPGPETLGLIELLASGCADTVIARTLGWSQRTTQRRIQQLMAELGASTRFQTALQAVRLGWLT